MAAVGLTRLRPAAFAVTLVMLAAAAVQAYVVVEFSVRYPEPIGNDFRIYLDATQQWLAGDGLYRAHQLAGPYVLEVGDVVYPPVVLYLTVPFALLPALAPIWWAVPLGVTVYAIARHQPAWWAWPYLAFILAWPRTWADVLYGNPAMWSVAAVGAGTLWGWPAIAAAVKPVLAPFVLVGLVRPEWRRRWGVAVLAGLALAIPFGAMWLDYVQVLFDAHNPWGLGYLLYDIPIAAAPVVAWAASTVPMQDPQDADDCGELVEPRPLPRGVGERHPL